MEAVRADPRRKPEEVTGSYVGDDCGSDGGGDGGDGDPHRQSVAGCCCCCGGGDDEESGCDPISSNRIVSVRYLNS